MDCTQESGKTDDVILKKPAQVSADPLSADQLSALFPPLTDEQAAEYAKYLGPATEKERTWGMWGGIRNLNTQGSDPLRPEDAPSKSAAEIGLWFKF